MGLSKTCLLYTSLFIGHDGHLDRDAGFGGEFRVREHLEGFDRHQRTIDPHVQDIRARIHIAEAVVIVREGQEEVLDPVYQSFKETRICLLYTSRCV